MLRSKLFPVKFILLLFPNLIELLDLHSKLLNCSYIPFAIYYKTIIPNTLYLNQQIFLESLLRKLKERRAKSEIVEFIGDVMLDSVRKLFDAKFDKILCIA